MKFFLNLLAILNVAYANLGFAGRHRGDHSVHHGNYSFHDHFAHALSVIRYYRQQRGGKSLLGTQIFVYNRHIRNPDVENAI